VRAPTAFGSASLPALVLILAIALLGGGCRSAVQPPLPLGIYAPGGASQLPQLREAGFNLVVGPADRAFLDAARRAGLGVLANPGTTAGPTFQPQPARRAVAQVGRHPALWGWYLADEPDLHAVTAAEVAAVQRTLRQAGSRRPTAVTVWNGAALSRYHQADVLMVDRYPVGLAPLASFFKEVRMGRMVADVAQRRFLPVVQAMDWAAYPPALWQQAGLPGGEAPVAGAPSLAQLRSMAWGARVLGADGLFFYAFDDGSWRLPDHPQVWSDVKATVEELRRWEPLWHAPQPRLGLGLQWREPGQRLNEALESSVLATVLDVAERTATAEVPSGRYVLLVNTTAKAQEVRLIGLAHLPGQLPELGSARFESLGEDEWLAPLDPFAIRILGPWQP
jgi:hypothetical protein